MDLNNIYKPAKGTLVDILDNPSEYTQDEVDFAKAIKKKLEEHGTVKYNAGGLDTIAQWTLEYYMEKDNEY